MRVHTVDSVAGTLFSVKRHRFVGEMVRVTVDTFDWSSGFFFLQGRSLAKSRQDLAADMNDRSVTGLVATVKE